MDLSYQPRFDCDCCPTRCDGRSKEVYVFEDDVALSEEAEDWLAAHFARSTGLSATKAPAQAHGLPDLQFSRDGQAVARVEVKAQGRAFMAVARLLPEAGLLPYETVALNLSDIHRYAEQFRSDGLPTFIVWRVKRPCLGEGYWGQRIERLIEIGNHYRERRQFRRRSTRSDYVDGQHKGVVVNYHFSLRELEPLSTVSAWLGSL